MGQILQCYHVAFLTLLLTASLAHWPTILNPLAQAYIRLCSHSLRHLPLFLQHYPPYVVATLLVGLVVLLGSAFVLLARQLVRQYRVAAGLNALQQPVHGSGATIADSCGIGNRLRVIQDQSVFAFCLGLVSPASM